MSFGQTVADRRKELGLSQKDLAGRIRKEDGTPISPQYLNDIERNRRNPPSDYLIDQFAQALQLDAEVLHYTAGQMPPELRDGYRPEDVKRAFAAFRKVLNQAPR